MAEERNFKFVVVGGGSGGSACSRRAAEWLGEGNVCIIERGPTRDPKTNVRTGAGCGGTCVNMGCVPKKLMFIAASHMDALSGGAATAEAFGVRLPGGKPTFDWAATKAKRDAYVQKLEQGYKGKWEKIGITVLIGVAKFVGPRTVEVAAASGAPTHVTGEHVLIATGGVPLLPAGIPGVDLPGVITSDGFFDLESQPKKCAVIGAGYIAVEMAGILHSLGTETTIFCRGDSVLRSESFERDIVTALTALMKGHGPTVQPNSSIASISATDKLLTLTMKDKTVYGGFDCVLFAIGRKPTTLALGLDAAGIKLDSRGQIEVNEYEDTNVENVHALGDVTNRGFELTPVAVAAGRRLADRLFGGAPLIRLPYEDIPTVVFSHPPIASCGLTVVQAERRYGAENICVQKSAFSGMLYAFNEAHRKGKTVFRIVLKLPEERVVGLHMLGPGVDEILQGFAVAIGMGATRADLEQCVAIHPTSAEELVTMGGWGLTDAGSGRKFPVMPPKLVAEAEPPPSIPALCGLALLMAAGFSVVLAMTRSK